MSAAAEALNSILMLTVPPHATQVPEMCRRLGHAQCGRDEDKQILWRACETAMSIRMDAFVFHWL